MILNVPAAFTSVPRDTIIERINQQRTQPKRANGDTSMTPPLVG